jgi:hypothetical protein
MRSSANNKEWRGGQPGPREIPSKLFESRALCMESDISLTARTNKDGERGQP